MPALFSPRLRHWLRVVAVALGLAGVLWLVLTLALPGLNTAPEKLTRLETAHLKLTAQTQLDLHPDFSRSISEPLNRMMPHRTDGLAQPLWPWVASWMHDPQDVAATLKGTGIFRIGLVLGFLLMLGLTCARSFALPAALWVLLMAGLHGFLPVLPHFTGETLHHMGLLVMWLACVYALQRNSLWVYGLIGISAALTWLADDRVVMPVLVVFLVVGSLRALWGWASAHFARMPGTSLWVWRNHWLGLLMLACTFFFIVGPRLVESHEIFGQAFFSHTDHARWLDTADEAQLWIETHPDAASLTRDSVLERPSAANALSGRSHAELLARLARGAEIVIQELGSALPQLAAMLGLLIALTLVTWTRTPKASHAGERLHPETATTALFVTVAIGACALIACWDAPVLPVGHLHGLVMLLALSLVWAATSLLRRAKRRRVSRWVILSYYGAMWAMVGWALLMSRATP
jgi:hypothetical protein